MNDKKGGLSISTLVIISAVVIVAALAFYLITTVVSEVTYDARAVSDMAQKNVGTAFNVVQLYGEDGTAGSVNYFYMDVKPPYGSEEITIAETMLIMNLDNDSTQYTYDNTIDCFAKNTTFSNSTYNDSNSENFGIFYLKGSSTYNGTIVGGETVRLCWKSPAIVETDDEISVQFFSVVGYGAKVTTSYSGLMSDTIIYFYP